MTVEAATVVFGTLKGIEDGDGRLFLERWLKRVCLDYRLHVSDGHYTVDMLFYKKQDRYWLTNRPALYSKRWGSSGRSGITTTQR